MTTEFDDELLSAVLDGDADPQTVAAVQADPDAAARLRSMRAAAALVATPPPPATPERRAASIAAALAAAQPAPEVSSLSRSLAKWNAMAPRDPLLPGKTLVIWLGSQAKAKASSASNTPVLPQDQLRKIKYRVRKGDSLARIANKFKVEVKDIRTWNSLQGKKYIHPGQVLTLLIDITRQSGR